MKERGLDPLVAQFVEARKAASLSHAKVAAAAGITERYLIRLEQGRSSPSLRVLRALGQALGLQPGWLPLAYETAPASDVAGNGAPEGGHKSPPDAPASDPVCPSCPLGPETFRFKDPGGLGDDWMHTSEFEKA